MLNAKEHGNDIHKAFISSARTQKLLNINSSTAFHVSYDENKDIGFFTASNLMDMFMGALGPFDAFKSQPYTLNAMNCCGDVPTWTFEVKPSIKIGFSLDLEYAFDAGSRSKNERRKEQSGKLIDERMSGGPGKQTLPKDFNQYRKGWTLETAPFFKSETTSFSVGVYCDIAGQEYTFTPYGVSREKKTLLDSLNGLAKVADIFNDFQDKFLCVSDKRVSEKSAEYPIFDFSFSPLKLGLTFFIDSVAKLGDAKLVCGLQGAPFFGGEIKIDVLQIAASYGGVLTKKLVNALQDALKKREGQRVSAGVNIDLTLSCELNCFIGMAKLPHSNKTEFCIDGKNSVEIEIVGDVNAYAEANIFSMTASFSFALELKTAASLELESHKNGIDLVVCHDGIVLALALSADIKKEKDGGLIDKVRYSPPPKEFELYDIADPLKANESDLRFNLLGVKKNVPQRERQRIKRLIPNGAPPGLKLKY
ncbi:hypothetical protein M2263_000531 [Providencia alcalifaciens]|nr:hypothetical protein [Providencia alcalifaciens]